MTREQFKAIIESHYRWFQSWNLENVMSADKELGEIDPKLPPLYQGIRDAHAAVIAYLIERIEPKVTPPNIKR